MRIWVTRAQPQAAATAARLSTLGHEPVVAPVIEPRLVPFGLEDLAEAEVLAVTSQAGVAALARFAPQLKALPVFAVGDATAAAASQAGFERVYSASGRVGDLVAMIAARPGLGTIVHVSAREPAGDLVGDCLGAALFLAGGVDRCCCCTVLRRCTLGWRCDGHCCRRDVLPAHR